mgnify:CR=1 FL=1|tara:strand:+ start:264 stop:1109 length:846 start_codon:yes stop_codon:yes gene_type:complete
MTDLPEMPPGDVPYAVASHIAYEYYFDGDPVLTEDKLQSLMDTYSIDNNLSNDMGVVLKNNNDNSAILAYRGTDPNNIYDLNADAQLATGLDNLIPFQTRLSRAEDMYISAKNVYPNLELSGHSLGGYLAEHVSRTNNEKAVVFNPGLTPITTALLPPVGSFKPIVYETDNVDILSHSVHNTSYIHDVDLRTITQRDDLDSWTGSHNLDSFLPISRHIVNSSDLLDLPSFPETTKPPPTLKTPMLLPESENLTTQDTTNICKNTPELVFCKRRPNIKKGRP